MYKILDMFAYLSSDRGQVRFVFLATSMKVDIVDSFEKRIKSRFSHRMVLFYEQNLDTFLETVHLVFNRLLTDALDDKQREQITGLQAIVMGDAATNALDEEFGFGK